MNIEQLLNKLIELGWKPFGLGPFYNYFNGEKIIDNKDITIKGKGIEYDYERYSLNDLCSIKSGLRQFVCEKGLYEIDEDGYFQIENRILGKNLEHFIEDTYTRKHYKYRIMLSSIQEDKTEFLLDNIIPRDERKDKRANRETKEKKRR